MGRVPYVRNALSPLQMSPGSDRPARLAATVARGLALAASLACLAAPTAAQPGTTPALRFGDVAYVHRWSGEGQHEFTPAADADLDRWRDMLTINLHPAARSGDALADVANRILSNYQAAGTVVRTASRPRAAATEAEHFIAALLARPDFVEAAFARVLLVDGAGVAVVASHREYGRAAGDAMAAWLERHGTEVENRLMGWAAVGAVRRLRR